jgi:phospholipid-translocating ATPase
MQAIYSLISPGWISTPIYGNDVFLFQSPIFWFGLPITVLLALAPRYIYKAWMFGFHANDVDIMRWNFKLNPHMDIAREAHMLSVEHKTMSPPSPPTTPARARLRQSLTGRGNQIDMATGQHSQSRGFDFATEENGVAMQRIQSNLSVSSRPTPAPERRKRSLLRSLRHPRNPLSMRRKRPPTASDLVEE